MNRLLAAAALTLFVSVPGCAAESDEEVGAHESDLSHPNFKLHPNVLLVGSIDEDAVYDVVVEAETLKLPRTGHEALLRRIVPRKSILVARANEDDAKKNPGFIRGVVSITKTETEVILKTVTLELVDVVRGHLALDKTEHPRFYRPGARTRRTASGLSPLSRGDDLKADVTAVLLDGPQTLLLPDLPFATDTYTLPGTSKKLDIKASMRATLETDLFLEVGVSGGIDVGWDGGTGFCLDTWFGRHCSGAPKIEGEAVLGTSYDFSITPIFEMNGRVEAKVEIPEVALTAACAIPPGIPCFVQGGLGGQIDARVYGALKFKTNKPFRMYGLSQFGGTFRNADIELKKTEGPKFDFPTGIVPTVADPDIDLAQVKGIPQVTLQSGMVASIEYGPVLRFGLGVPEVANIHAEATLRYRFGGGVAVCSNVTSLGFIPTGLAAGGHWRGGPELKIGFGVDAGPFHPEVKATLYDGYDVLASFGNPDCLGLKSEGRFEITKE